MTDAEIARRYLAALVHVARADGPLTPAEVAWIEHAVQVRWHQIVDDTTVWFADAGGLDGVAELGRGPLRERAATLLVDDAVALGVVDGPLDELERDALGDLGRLLELDVYVAAAIRRAAA